MGVIERVKFESILIEFFEGVLLKTLLPSRLFSMEACADFFCEDLRPAGCAVLILHVNCQVGGFEDNDS